MLELAADACTLAALRRVRLLALLITMLAPVPVASMPEALTTEPLAFKVSTPLLPVTSKLPPIEPAKLLG